MIPLLAHVLAPPGNHLIFLWPASAVLAAGILVAAVERQPSRRRLWMGVAAVGLAATVVVYVVEPSYAQPPNFSIRLVVATGPGDAGVQVCPVASNGSTPAVPGSDRLMDVFVDGKVGAEGASPRFLIQVPPGRHAFYAVMVQHDHVAFLPAEVTNTVIAVVPPGLGTGLPATSC
ncbi:MAG: hypothetical protein WCB85_05665 [Candidatus Dormiibacterota bacterium]